jgi:colanic acid/amylovoran biosynthesis protein
LKSIVLMGATLSGNRGAETMLTASCGRLHEKYPSATLHIFSYYPETDRRLCKRSWIQIHDAKPQALLFVLLPLALLDRLCKFFRLPQVAQKLCKRIQILANADVMIDLAGEAFRDGREPFLIFNLITLWPAFVLKTPVIKFAQALGPARGILTRAAARHALNHCRKSIVRGQISFDHMHALKPSSPLKTYADLGFALKPEDRLSEENTDYADAQLQKMNLFIGNWIAVSPNINAFYMAKLQGRDYVTWYADLIKTLRSNGFKILIFPNCSREGKYRWWHRNNDIPIILKIKKTLALDDDFSEILFITKPLNTATLRLFISKSRLVLASRFHAMISSLACGIPVIAMSGLHKYREVLQDFKMEEYLLEECSAKTSDVVTMVTKAIDQEKLLKQQILKRLPAVIASAKAQFDYV